MNYNGAIKHIRSLYALKEMHARTHMNELLRQSKRRQLMCEGSHDTDVVTTVRDELPRDELLK